MLPKEHVWKRTRPRTQPTPRDLVQDTIPLDLLHAGLGDVIQTISIPDISECEDVDVTFRDVVSAGGYNWMKDDEEEDGPAQPRIIVLGIPHIWTPPKLWGRMRPDSDIVDRVEYMDQNAAKLLPMGISPLEPIFHSLLTPSSPSPHVDLITDRSNLRKLFHHISLLPPSRDPLEFRIDAQLAPAPSTTGSDPTTQPRTVLFTRWNPTDIRKPHGDVPRRGWRYEFASTCLKGYDSDRGEKTDGCHRLARYSFAGLNLLVRFEIDGCLPGDWLEGIGVKERGLEDLMTDLGLSDEHEGGDKRGLQVTVRPDATIEPPQSSLLELKTRKWTRSLHPLETYAQLVFSQTPLLYVGRHKEGDFGVEPLEEIRLDGEEMNEVGKAEEGSLRRLGMLLRGMVMCVREAGDVCFLRVEGGLQVRKLGKRRGELSERAVTVLQEL